MSLDWTSGPARRRELMLLILAMAVAVLARVSADAGATGGLTTGTWTALAWLGGLALACHLATRWLAPNADPLILPIMITLVGLSAAEIHRLDLAMRHPGHIASVQLVWATVGAVGFIATLALVRRHSVLSRYPYLGIALAMVGLALPAVLPARFSEVNGAKIWLRFGGFSVQPGEFVKLVLIASVSSYLTNNRDSLVLLGRRFLGVSWPRARHMGPLLVAWASTLLLLVFEHDLGMSILFFGIVIALLYVATNRASWVIAGVFLAGAGAYAAQLALPHVHQRIQVWLNPFADPAGADYQIDQGLFGLANGGLLGTGLGRGHPQLVPFANSDFIISSLGEEIGLAGLFAILACYLVLAQRGLKASLDLRDTFGKLMAAGLAFGIALQVFIIVGGVTQLIPLTGLTTPFLSYGGSSLVASWIAGALLIRLSDAAHPAQTPAAAPKNIGNQHTELVHRPASR